MKLAIMQPYFIPYLGYFSLIKHTDHWVVFDTPQFPRHGWVERNRILKPREGWQYIRIPLRKFSRNTAIKDVIINRNEDYKKRILAQLEHYKKKAPFYDIVIDLMSEILSLKTTSIVDLNINALKILCEYIDLPFYFSIFSNFSDRIPNINNPDDWALEIAKLLNASTYYNPPRGIDFFNRDKFKEAGIELGFLEIMLDKYDQRRENFKPALSIVDVMMFNSSNDIKLMLDNYIIT